MADEAVLNKVQNPLFKVSKDGFNRSFIIDVPVPTGTILIEGIFGQCKTMFEAFPFKVLFSRYELCETIGGWEEP